MPYGPPAPQYQPMAQWPVATWQACPICRGRGTVQPGFYSHGEQWSGTSTAREKCRSCNGRGIVR